MALDIDDRRYQLLMPVFIVLATLFVYAQAVRFDFVIVDDHVYVTNNPHVLAGLTRDGVAWAFTTSEYGHWIPMTWLSLMADTTLYGSNPWGYHLTNIMWHIANSLLLFFLFKAMTGALWESAFLAAMFALHPLHVEPVAWISSRKDVLSTFWGILALWAYYRYACQPSIHRYLAVFFCFCFGLMAKPMLVTFPFLLLLLDRWPLGRWGDNEENSSPGTIKKQLFFLVLEKIPFFVITAIFSAVTYWAQNSCGCVVTLDNLPIEFRIANAAVAIVKYVIHVIWPNQLAVYYPLPLDSLPLWKAAIAGVAVIGVSVIAICAWKKRPYLMVGYLWFIGTLVPVLGLVQIGKHAMADRFMYIPMIGIGIVFAWGVADIVRRFRLNRRMVTVGVAIFLVAWTLQARAQTGYWQNSVTLYERSLAVTPQHFDNLVNLGNALLTSGDPERAAYYLTQATAMAACSAPVHFSLGMALSQQGEYAKAALSLEEAVRLDHGHIPARNQLGLTLASMGETEVAVKHFKAIIEMAPEYAGAHLNLGVIYENTDKFRLAADHFRTAATLSPDMETALYRLVRILATCPDETVRNGPEALSHAKQLVQLTGEQDPLALSALAAAQAECGHFEIAVGLAQQAAATADAYGIGELSEQIRRQLNAYRAGRPFRESGNG